MSKALRTICLHWPRLGPYHLARLDATHTLLAEHGIETVALETASGDAVYAWDEETGPTPFRREQVFPGRVFEEITPSEMHAGVTTALDRIDPDAVAITSYSFPDARACLAWCRHNRRTAVLMLATKADDTERSRWKERIKGAIVGQYDAALVGGTPQRAYLHQLDFPDDLVFTPYNSVDNTFFAEGAAQARRSPESVAHLPGLDGRSPYFLASNRFVERKNLPRLLSAYAAYRSRVPEPWNLLLLGDGPQRPMLEARVQEEAIEGVVFCGFRQRDELPAYYGLAGAFVHPTLLDQWALVVNEAMAAGLPVLVSNHAGCAIDLVDPGVNGYTFDPEAVNTIADLFEHMAAPKTDRAAMGARSRALVAAFAPERFAEGLWAAVQAGRGRARRPLAPLPALALGALRLMARSATSFHDLRD